MKTYSKESLIGAILEIVHQGWIPNARPGNAGGIGNTLEDLLGIPENNLPIPNASEWELKCQRANTTALTTLFHLEPSPRAMKFVSQVFLPQYGWSHQEAGNRYRECEMSFRQTIHGNSSSDRGFKIIIDRKSKKVLVSFDATTVSPRHSEWLWSVQQRAGLDELNPQPYWGFDDPFHKAGTKLANCFYVQAEVKRIKGEEFFHYNRLMLLEKVSLDKFLVALEKAYVLVDFDARSGHNHGTKFRLRQNRLPDLYETATEIACG